MTKDKRYAANNLLAIIHRDGGHHTSEVGFIQSCKDAEARYYELLDKIDKSQESEYKPFQDGTNRRKE